MSSKAQIKEFNPFDLVVNITSTENFFMVQSSNKYDWYGVLLTGPNAAICSCPAAVHGIPCKHRKSVLARWTYVTPWEDELDEFTLYRLNRIEDEAQKDEMRRLFGDNWTPTGPDAA